MGLPSDFADVTQQLSEDVVLMRDALDEVFAALAEGEILLI